MLSWISSVTFGLYGDLSLPSREADRKIQKKRKNEKKIGRKIVGCSVAADGQIMVDYEDQFDEFGDSKCSLCQRRFEEQGKLLQSLRRESNVFDKAIRRRAVRERETGPSLPNSKCQDAPSRLSNVASHIILICGTKLPPSWYDK